MRFAFTAVLAAIVTVAACAAAPIGSLDGNGVALPDRTSETDDGDAGATPRANATTAVLSVTLVGAGTVTSAPSGVSCTGATCSGIFPIGTAVSLAASPTGGGAFSAWGGACTGTSACKVTLASSTAVTATFADLGGTWTGPYENLRPKNNCNFDNKGTLTLTTATDADAGATVRLSATMDGLELRDGRCNLVERANGVPAPTRTNAAVIAAGALTGTWTVDVGNGGPLDFPFQATIRGTTMTGAWTCTGCTGAFTLTRQP